MGSSQWHTNGTTETTFSPDDTCTRGQIVTFLYRYAGASAEAAETFSDVDANAYYAAPVAWAVANGITNGTSDTTFSPDSACTRAQVVTFLYRYAAV
ncbi:MAG: S-layer homology domain-containing protein [Oscillospiraceae bacterium]|nr:S-layer homology domain-containing protein [Oscillospiraceae bacterium]